MPVAGVPAHCLPPLVHVFPLTLLLYSLLARVHSVTITLVLRCLQVRDQKLTQEEDSDGYLEGNDGAVEPPRFDSEASSEQVRLQSCARCLVLCLTCASAVPT